MRLREGNFVGKLKTPLCEILAGRILDGGAWCEMKRVRPYEINQLLRDHKAYGKPEFIAMEPGQYLFTVFPIPDRRYECKVIGTVICEQ